MDGRKTGGWGLLERKGMFAAFLGAEGTLVWGKGKSCGKMDCKVVYWKGGQTCGGYLRRN
jgi:hypothetical protein